LPILQKYSGLKDCYKKALLFIKGLYQDGNKKGRPIIRGRELVSKKIILLLMVLSIVLSIVISGCLSSENKKEEHKSGGSSGGSQRPREVKTPVGMHGEMGTPTETETQEEMGTPKEAVTSGTPDEPGMEQTGFGTKKGEQTGAVQPDETVPTSHPVRLKDYLMIPSTLKINTGDTVVWKNYQESSMLTLTSREHLFEDQRLAYGNTMKYTFDEPGTYNFSVKGYPKMQMTITVK
jgi:plastocyanin